MAELGWQSLGVLDDVVEVISEGRWKLFHLVSGR